VNLQAYLDRVKFTGKPKVDLDTLRRLHRGHVENIPYENLDVQFGREVSRNPEAIFDKLVTRRRGGWCYEMNGLLSWVLRDIGFDVTHMAGGVMRAAVGDDQVGNHLVLQVQLDRPYIADVGFGDGLIEPAPLDQGPVRQSLFAFALEDLGDDWWRFHNDPRGAAASFDFQSKRADEALLDDKCAWLQSSPVSPFVQNAVVQRHLPDGFAVMRGRILKTMGADVQTRQIESARDYAVTLERVFALSLPEAEELWPKIDARHAELFGRG